MQSQIDQKDIPNSFPGIPAFPDDVSTAPLLRLSSAKLLAGDDTEQERLFQASTDIGFFYLDLSDAKLGLSLLGDADNLFEVGKKLFELSLEEKNQYDFSGQNSYFGYKAQGAMVVDKQGNPDRNEFYNVRQHRAHSTWTFTAADTTIHRFPKTIFWASVIRYPLQRP